MEAVLITLLLEARVPEESTGLVSCHLLHCLEDAHKDVVKAERRHLDTYGQAIGTDKVTLLPCFTPGPAMRCLSPLRTAADLQPVSLVISILGDQESFVINILGCFLLHKSTAFSLSLMLSPANLQ